MEIGDNVIAKAKKIKKRIAVLAIIVIVLLLFCLYLFARQILGDEAGDLLLGAGIPNGFVAIGNWFRNQASTILWCFLSIGFILLLDFLLFLIINLAFKKSARSKTIGSLLKSLVKYSSVIAGVCIVLGICGVNATAIFAGLGVVGLIIGLACKTLVGDIVSGLFIVIDNYFQIGDKVIIDGFTGFVETIGLRTTKIKDWQGNLKSINNSSFSTVTNLSRYQSVAIVHIDISFNEDLVRVESIIAKNLIRIKERIPELLNVPEYKGVEALDDCGVQLCFFADVLEADRVSTQRKLLRELYLIFVENDVIIPFKQLVVNPPDPVGKPRANDEEKAISNEMMYPKKKVDKIDNSKKKKKLKIVDAIKEASKISEEE